MTNYSSSGESSSLDLESLFTLESAKAFAVSAFPSTEYFKHTRNRPDRIGIRDEWILRGIAKPLKVEIQSDGRIRRWIRISEFDNRALRIILLDDGRTVHNAFFDRQFTEEPK